MTHGVIAVGGIAVLGDPLDTEGILGHNLDVIFHPTYSTLLSKIETKQILDTGNIDIIIIISSNPWLVIHR